MTYRILITGANAADKRIIERALYTGWTLTGWTESNKGFAVLAEGADYVDPTYQMGRLQSFGYWGLKYDPTSEDVIRAVGRIRP